MGPATPLSIVFSRAPGVVSLIGGLDAAGVAALDAAFELAGDAETAWLIDLGRLESIDTGGVTGLVALRSRTIEKGAPVRLVRLRPAVARVLQGTGLHDVCGARTLDDVAFQNDFA